MGRESNQPSWEEVMDKADEQRAWSSVTQGITKRSPPTLACNQVRSPTSFACNQGSVYSGKCSTVMGTSPRCSLGTQNASVPI